MGKLKHFVPWDIFLSVGIETFPPRIYFGLGLLKHFAAWGIETFLAENI